MASICPGRTKTAGASSVFVAKRKSQGSCQGNVYQGLNKDDGVEEIIRILDEIFQSDETARAYHAFKEHVEYRWKIGGQNFSSFVVEYGKRYREVKHCQFDLPTGMQAFFLLQAANLRADLEKLGVTTAALVYGDMKNKKIKKC